MKTVLVDNLDKRTVAGASQRRATNRFGLGLSNIMRWARLWQRHDHAPAKPQGRARRSRAILAVAFSVFVFAAGVSAQTYDPPITTLVKNTDQSSGSNKIIVLNKYQTGLLQGFRTGPRQGGYELTAIWLYVRDTHESRYMTINAELYRARGDHNLTKIADLTKGRLNDFAHNDWPAPANTYLEPNADYYFALECVAGCANDNVAEFGTTYSGEEDSGAEDGWTIQNRLAFRSPGIVNWLWDNSEILRIQIEGRPSPHRAYKTEIISTPLNGRTYRYGENIDIALTFNTDVYVPPDDAYIGIRVGNAAANLNARAAEYLSGSGTNRLLYRYQVQTGDADTNGISVDAGGPDAGFGGTVPTIVGSLGLLPVDRYFPGVADHGNHKVDGSLHVTDTEITSTPTHGDGYRLGEDIDVTFTFSAAAYVASDNSVIAIRVGDATDNSNYRAAGYVSGSGTNRLVYRYQVQLADFDTTGISVDAGGPHSGFGGPLPTTRPDLGSIPTSRDYPGVAEDASHKVDLSVSASFDADAFTVSEDGAAATVTVALDADPERAITIPIAAGLGNGATADDYSLSADSLDFALGETVKSFTVTATDDSEDDDGESVELSFGILPPGVIAGSHASATVTIADNDGAATGQTVTISAGRDAYSAALDDVIFNLTLAEASDEAVTVNVRLTQEQPFLNPADLTQRVEFPAHATAAELRIYASRHNQGVMQSGALTATVIGGAGYHVGTPAAASVRMAVSNPALIARLGQTLYRFDEGATGTAASIEVIMETQPGFPAPNRSHDVTVSTESATAVADVDYGRVAVTVTFAPEAFSATDGRWVARQWIEVSLIDDALDELEEVLMVTLARDASLGDLIEVRNPNRTQCDGPCQSRIVIVDNDAVGVTFLDSDGNPLTDFRLQVREGERATYQFKLDRRPAQWVILAWEPGDGDADLVSLGEQSWLFSPAEDATSLDVHHWQEAFSVTVEALQDNDVFSGERRFHHYLSSDGLGQDRVELPDVVVVEIDNEADGPLRIFGVPEVVSRPVSGGDTYGLGERIEIEVTFTQSILVTGSPYLEFDLGNPGAGRPVRANFAAGDGTQTLTFGYTVGRDDWDDDGLEIGAGALRLNGGTIQSAETDEHAALDHTATGVQSAHKVRGPATLSVADAQATEEAGATLDFVITLSRAAAETVTVDYATADGTATAGEDYTAASGALTFTAGETQKTVSAAVLDDAHDEGEETLTLTLSNASGAHVADDSATGTIENNDPLQQAWLARFGRTAAQHVLDGVQARLTASRQPGMQATVVGHTLGDTGEATAAQDGFRGLSEWVDGEEAIQVRFQPQLLTTRDLLTRSAFTLSGETDGGFGAVWGRGAHSGFDGSVDGLSLDGRVTTGMLGADYAVGRWVVGLSLSHSKGDGSWHSANRGNGTIASSLTGLYPYAGCDLTERLSLWGVSGYGQGDLTLTLQDGASYRTDMDLTMAAVGVRGDIVSGQRAGGLSLAFESDALLVRTTSEAASGPADLLAAAVADVSRLRLGLEGSVELALTGGGSLTPMVELGLRHDGGDAETGFGVELGGGLIFADAVRGLMAQVMVRGLLAHEASGFRDWGVSGSLRFDPTPSSERGPSVSLTPSWGSSASGGVAALLGRDTLAGLASTRPPAAAGGRVDAEAAYGLAVFNGQATGTPYLGVGLSEVAREVRVGYRLRLPRRERLQLGIEGIRRDSTLGGVTPEHGIMLRLAVQ